MVVNGGRYYREDASLAPYVADVEVIVTERAPSDGSGFEITATVETDTSKSTFGKIAALTITNAGNGYLAWQWRDAKCCGDYYNGLSVVLRRDPQFPCRYSHRMCGVGNVSRLPGSIDLLYGQGTLGNQATLFLAPDAGGQSVTCGATFTASEPSPNCSDFASEGLLFTATGGVTATVVAGGVYDGAFRNPGGQRSCHVCCRGAAVSPTEVTVELTESGADGTYVLTQSPGLFISAPGVSNGWSLVVQGARPIEVVIYSCGVQTLDILNPGWEGADAIGLSDCDHCWKKCVVRVNSMIAGSSWDSGQTCAACQDSPVCGPYGTYDLYLSGQFSGRATIS